MTKVLSSVETSTDMNMLFSQITIFHDDISVTYLVPSNEADADVLETAFGDDAVFDGFSYRIEPGISRKKVLVPPITDVLESYPKE